MGRWINTWTDRQTDKIDTDTRDRQMSEIDRCQGTQIGRQIVRQRVRQTGRQTVRQIKGGCKGWRRWLPIVKEMVVFPTTIEKAGGVRND